MGMEFLHVRPRRRRDGVSVTARALPALLDIVAAHPGQTVIVVSPKVTIHLLLSSLLGFDPRFYRDHLDQSPAASMSSTPGTTSTRA